VLHRDPRHDDRQAQPRRHGRQAEPRGPPLRRRYGRAFPAAARDREERAPGRRRDAPGVRRKRRGFRAGREEDEGLGREGLRHSNRRAGHRTRLLLLRQRRQSAPALRAAEVAMALKLRMICGPYDRARALIEGAVKPAGIDLDVTVAEDPGRPRAVVQGGYDVAEFYSGLYIADLAHKTFGYTAIPIFVKRMFRHSYIYVNKRAGIRAPKDLNGKRVGIQTWFTTTALW